MFTISYLFYKFVMWLVAGGVAGFLAGKFMGVEGGWQFNIIVGIIGGVVGGFLLNLLGFSAWGLVANILVAFAGSCIFLWVAGKLFGR